MKKCIKCGSHAFNLYAEKIDQGGWCDVHYWEGRAHRAEALAQPLQKPVATMKMLHTYGDTTPPKRPWVGLTDEDKNEIIRMTERDDRGDVMALVEAKLKEKNT